MNSVLIIIFTIFLTLAIVLFFTIKIWGKRIGVLTNEKIYSDTNQKPGEVLYSTTLNLVGKPDYLIIENGLVIPVELKTGKTPNHPYNNHVIQLLAYCLLVEENYGIKPPLGYIKYPKNEFKIEYTNEAKEMLTNLVTEVLEKKISKEEQHCDHFKHNNV